MKIFLPDRKFAKSAQVLDWRRLGQQRAQNLLIMQTLVGCKVITRYIEPLGKYDDLYFDSDDMPISYHAARDREDVYVEPSAGFNFVDLDKEDWRFVSFQDPYLQNHPAVKMWRGHERSLLQYQHEITYEWFARGRIDTCWDKTHAIFTKLQRRLPDRKPDWVGNKDLHTSHQSTLIRENPEHYNVFFPDVPTDLPYIWPVT